MINIKEIWNMTLKCIEDKIPQKIYENYFDDVKLLSLDKNIATVVVPNELSKTLLEGQYKQNLQDSLLEVTETLYDLKFILSSELEENTSSTSSENLSKASFFKHSKLNPNYTFDNFVVGESNESAYKASHLIADHLATLNPLFIYSASGLGKTHLMHAIGNYVLSVTPLKKVLRLASSKDLKHAEDLKKKEKEAFEYCNKKIKEYKLDMTLTDVEYKFDNSKILFSFTSDGRVDFRELVKDLAATYKTRIELRQIGVRDEVKRIGGNGVCGRELCCCSFLGDFETVSIKMAKEQNLSLNPTKISGNCGRLMCCLKYEQEVYEEKEKRLPHVGAIVKTPDGVGEVDNVETLKETVRVRIKDGDIFKQKRYEVKDIKVIKDVKIEENSEEDKIEEEN